MKKALITLIAAVIASITVPLALSAPAGAATVQWSPSGGCGSVQSTTVPAGATSMTVNIAGGKGGRSGSQASSATVSGGNGGQLVATIAVTPGQTVSAIVGCNGADGGGFSNTTTTKGWSTGGGTGRGSIIAGQAGASGGAGGGSSAVCLSATCTAGNGTVVAVAGGGGGGGVSNCAGTPSGPGGAGGAAASTSGFSGSGPSGANGSGGGNSGGSGGGGGGGTGGANNSGGGADGGSNGNGSGGLGVNVVGGGGGGGRVGGGAGGNSATGCKGGGGGGGGSSWAQNGATGVSTGTAASGSVSVTFTIPETAPSAPVIGVATGGNASATVTWSAPSSNGGSPITGYVVTPFIGATAQSPITFASAATSQVVTGLTNGTTYTFKVAAKNAVGTGPQSAASNAVTPAAVPGAPTIGTATVTGRDKVSLSWTAPAVTGGSSLTGYVVTPFIGGSPQTAKVFDATATTRTITGLTPGTTYTFKVAATNGVGTGNQSAASNAVTPPIYYPFASIDDFIDQQFLDFANRAPTDAERAAWTTALVEGTQSPAALIDSLRTAPYWEPEIGPVIRLYSAYFLRRPDTSGLDYWVAQRRGGKSISQISNLFSGSKEFKDRYGTLDDAAFVTLVYQNVLGRAPDASGLAFWVGRLDAGVTRGWVMAGFSNSLEYTAKMAPTVQVITTYYGMLRRVPTAGELSAGLARLSGGASVQTLIDDILGSEEYRARVA